MKVYKRVTVDIETGARLDEESYEYWGKVALATGGSGGGQSSNPSFVIPGLLPDIRSAAIPSIIQPAMGIEKTVQMPQGGGYSIPQTLTDINMQRAINQVRGGYGARGLAGSGIAAAGEQAAIGQLALQGQAQNQGALTNLLSAGTGTSSQSKQSTGISVICSELYRQKRLPRAVYVADTRFGLSLPQEVLVGYHFWAVPLTRLMQQSQVVTSIVASFAIPWAQEMHHRVTGIGKGHWLGRALLKVGAPINSWIGRRLICRDQHCRSLARG